MSLATHAGTFGGFCVLLVAVFFLTKPLLPRLGLRPKDSLRSDAWILTAFVATAMTLVGLDSSFALLTRSWHPAFLADEGLVDLWWTPAVNLFFMAHCAVDMVLGFFFYREAMDPLAGWVHHIAYLGFLSYLIHAGVSRMFVFFGVEEIPTLMLALGNFDPRLRTDGVFGLVFLAFRVLYHGYILLLFVQFAPHRTDGLVLVGLTLALHVHWWVNWVRGYTRRQRKQASGEPVEETDLPAVDHKKEE